MVKALYRQGENDRGRIISTRVSSSQRFIFLGENWFHYGNTSNILILQHEEVTF